MGDIGHVERYFQLSQLGGEGANGIKWVEAREAAKHPTCTGQPPTTKNEPAPNVSSAERNPVFEE